MVDLISSLDLAYDDSKYVRHRALEGLWPSYYSVDALAISEKMLKISRSNQFDYRIIIP